MNLLPVISLFLPGVALDFTEMAPAMGGDAELRYSFSQERAQLMEGSTQVGKRTISTHQVNTLVSFNPVKGAGLFFILPTSPDTSVSFTDAQQMGFDPGNDSGSMLTTEGLASPPTISGSGLQGVWLGLRGSPLHEELYASRGDRVSWVFDIGYRFKDKTHFYTVDSEGSRGSGPGSSAWLLQGAFSTTHNQTQPYVVIRWLSSGVALSDITDEDGEVLTQNVDIRPASTVTLRTGAAFPGHRWGQGVNSGRFLFDPHLEFGYQSWQDVPSGTYLPDVLDASIGLLATESEHVFLSSGLNLDIRIMRYLELDIGADVGIRSARRVEHFYPVSTSMGTLTWQTSAALRFRARDPMIPSPESSGFAP
jgi:hypothetical protein